MASIKVTTFVVLNPGDTPKVGSVYLWGNHTTNRLIEKCLAAVCINIDHAKHFKIRVLDSKGYKTKQINSTCTIFINRIEKHYALPEGNENFNKIFNNHRRTIFGDLSKVRN
jgi:hypothetical protein